MRRKWERMLTLKTFWTEASVVERSERPAAMPALLTRMVGLPSVERIEDAVVDTDDAEVMSHE